MSDPAEEPPAPDPAPVRKGHSCPRCKARLFVTRTVSPQADLIVRHRLCVCGWERTTAERTVRDTPPAGATLLDLANPPTIPGPDGPSAV